MFREKLRTMGKSSKAKFTKLATMFSRRAPGGAGRMLGQAPAPSKDNLLLNAEPLVNCRDSEEEAGSDRSTHSKEDVLDVEEETDMTDLVVRTGFNGLSIEYRPVRQKYWYCMNQSIEPIPTSHNNRRGI